MKTIYLKLADEAQAVSALAQYRMVDEHGVEQWVTGSHSHALDIVGTHYRASGVMLATEFGDVPEMSPIPGFHINMMIDELPPALLPFVITPVTPSRVFAS